MKIAATEFQIGQVSVRLICVFSISDDTQTNATISLKQLGRCVQCINVMKCMCAAFQLIKSPHRKQFYEICPRNMQTELFIHFELLYRNKFFFIIGTNWVYVCMSDGKKCHSCTVYSEGNQYYSARTHSKILPDAIPMVIFWHSIVAWIKLLQSDDSLRILKTKCKCRVFSFSRVFKSILFHSLKITII